MRTILRRFDTAFIRRITRLPASIKPLMQLGTLLGQPALTMGISAGIVGYGVARSSEQLVLLGSIAVATIIITSALKVTLRRPRPENDYVKTMLVKTFSFPSGHAAGSVVAFGLLAYVASLPLWAAPLLAGVCIMIGVSRVYLGAHYPTDVVGGWILGCSGLIAIMIVGK